MTSSPVIAIDGPAGSGKSSTSRGVAARLGLRYLDTGAMYRAMAWAMLRRGVDVSDVSAVAALAEEPVLEISTSAEGQRVTCDGVDVTADIRSAEVTAAVSSVSAVPEVRARMVRQQREAVAAALEAGTGIVVEGRDIGTVVLPDATLKVFLTADEAARAARRALEEAVRDGHSDPEAAAEDAADAMREKLAVRDARDSTRAVSPLRSADDAVSIDSSALTLEAVIDQVVQLVEERRSNA